MGKVFLGFDILSCLSGLLYLFPVLFLPRALSGKPALAVGVEQNVTRAVELFRQSRELGDHMGMYNLGTLYFNGMHGIERNDSQALIHFQEVSGLLVPMPST
jgi:hypothetical protein